MSALDTVRWNADGLVPVITQDAIDGRVLMLAWMNREALAETIAGGEAVYFSRSRQALWRKGERSGHTQIVRNLALDCDGDTLLLEVEQQGGVACHTGRRSCFYQTWVDGDWQPTEPVLKDPADLYGAGTDE
ncbi:MAG: phosphoribosyl-AMP cyclohydrolase [Spiribacter sp.]|jgi:phosphoribosyl-AMP cyclohydrolase|nr:phosphoribosyl-AMP cyclohydrolase [Spiribacter sp.]MDR9480027.1 phosphoribosyl-AMP cyclohydrolase [Spiribacter sp.]